MTRDPLNDDMSQVDTSKVMREAEAARVRTCERILEKFDRHSLDMVYKLISSARDTVALHDSGRLGNVPMDSASIERLKTCTETLEMRLSEDGTKDSE